MKSEWGFTLIELLIVLAIIGILAAIAIPVFLTQRQRGWVVQSHAALRAAATALEAYGAANGGDYSGADGECSPSKNNPCATADDILLDEGFRKASSVKIQVAANNSSYCIVAVHDLLGAGPPAHDWSVATWDSNAPGPSDEDNCPAL